MILTLYENFSKRSNSTKRPEGGYIVDVKLKNNTSLERPVFLIDGINLEVNYCKWNDAFYFINDIILGNNNIYELHCSIDVLATYKDAILNTSAYIEHSTTGDTTIPDQRIPVKTSPSVTLAYTDPIFDFGGTYYTAVTGEGTVGFYKLLSRSDLNDLVFDISSAYFPSEPNNVVDAIEKFGKQLIGSGSISENIRACYWLPYNARASEQAQYIKVGLYESHAVGYDISELNQVSQYTVNIPWQFSDWRNTSPYSEVYLYLPYIGTVSFPASNLMGATSLVVRRSINIASGSIAYEVTGNGLELGTYSADIAVAIPIGSSNINPATTAGGLIAGAGAIISSGNVAGKILGVATASLSGLKALNTSSGGVGGGAGAGLNLRIYCFVVTHGTTVEPSTFASIWGYPYGRIDTIGNHSGYVMTNDFSVNAPIHEDERQMINTLMNSGVYIE